MGLTRYIQDLGRAVAYFPSLKRITTSTTASILLCQLLYWTDKTKDGWIWKTSDEIEYETGLTYNEQRTARKILLDLDLIEEEYKRLDHYIRYRVRQEVLNAQWEEQGGESIALIESAPGSKNKKEQIEQALSQAREETEQQEKNKPEKKDWMDLALGDKAQEVNIIDLEKNKIRETIEKKLNLTEITSNPKWLSFIDFAYNRNKKHGENIDVFLNWTINNDAYRPEYWTPQKMKNLWGQAFLDSKIDENFVKELEIEEEEDRVIVPPPKDFGIRKTLFNQSNLD